MQKSEKKGLTAKKKTSDLGSSVIFVHMWSVCKKDLRQFFSGLTGYVAIIAFLLLNGLMLFVFRDSNILDDGYASLDNYFSLAPWVLLLLIPAITMRLFSEEWRAGTIETLKTRPLTGLQIVGGKYLSALLVVLLALLPTLIYIVSIKSLEAGNASLDTGGIIGSYIGLGLLCASFTAVGTWCSSFTANAIIAFLLSAFGCFILYSGFNSLSKLPQFLRRRRLLPGNAGYRFPLSKCFQGDSGQPGCALFCQYRPVFSFPDPTQIVEKSQKVPLAPL